MNYFTRLAQASGIMELENNIPHTNHSILNDDSIVEEKNIDFQFNTSEMSTNPEPPIEQSSNPEPPIEQSSNPEPPIEQSSNPEPPIEQSSNPEPPIEQSSNPEPPIEQSSNLKPTKFLDPHSENYSSQSNPKSDILNQTFPTSNLESIETKSNSEHEISLTQISNAKPNDHEDFYTKNNNLSKENGLKPLSLNKQPTKKIPNSKFSTLHNFDIGNNIKRSPDVHDVFSTEINSNLKNTHTVISKNSTSIVAASKKILGNLENKEVTSISTKNQPMHSENIEQNDFTFSIGTINVKINPTPNSTKHKTKSVAIQKYKQRDMTRISRYYVRL